jgi:DNA-binding MurR/RpiR family transcriptional regulator
VRNIPATLDLEQFEGAVDALCHARRVLFVGNGSSATLVHHAGFTGRLIGLTVEAPTEMTAQELAAANLTPEDACVAFSQTGSRLTVATQSIARDTGAKTIAITSFTHSPITEVTDFTLVAGGDLSAPYRLQTIPARLALMALLDCLLLAVAERTQPESNVVWDRLTAIQLRHAY